MSVLLSHWKCLSLREHQSLSAFWVTNGSLMHMGSNPMQKPADRSKEGAQEAGGTLVATGAGSQQTVLVYDPAAHLMHLVNYCMKDHGCPWSQWILQGASVLGSSQASSLIMVYHHEQEGRWAGVVLPASTWCIPLGTMWLHVGSTPGE